MLLIVVVANGAFLGLNLLTTTLSREALSTRIVQGFETNALPQETDLRFETWMLGNECLILQMLLDDEGPRIRHALGPKVPSTGGDGQQCKLVWQLVRGDHAIEALDSFYYTRYWHGHNASAAAILSLMDYEQVRMVLPAVAYGSFAALALVALFAVKPLGWLGLSMAVAGVAFWALHYFAGSLGHGPADIVLTLGFVILLFRYRHGVAEWSYPVACATFGAVVTYMEFFTGQLPLAAALLLPFGYLACSQSAYSLRRRWRYAASGLFAFALGAALTIIIKQSLAYHYFGSDALSTFGSNLRYYTQNLDQIGFLDYDNHLKSALFAAGGVIWKWGKVLTYGSESAATILFATTALAWLVGLGLAWRAKSRDVQSEFAICLLGAGIIAAWIAIFPLHSLGHGWFMVRMLIAPIILGWVALAISWQGYLNAASASVPAGNAAASAPSDHG